MNITEMIEIPGHGRGDTQLKTAGVTRGEGQDVDDTQAGNADAPSEIPGQVQRATQSKPAGTADQDDSTDQLQPIQRPSLLVGQIREEHRLREDYRRAAASLHLRMCAIIRRVTGCAKSEATKILKQVFAPQSFGDTQVTREGEGDRQDPIVGLQTSVRMSPAQLYPLLAPMHECQLPLIACQRSYEKTLIKMAKQLPVWPWVESVRGFGALALAQIVGEAGDISDYENPAKLWKRMGLAVIGGEKQGKHIDAEKAKAHGYSPKRRAVSWNIGCCLIKLNDGKYRDYYDKEKARQMVKLELPEDKPGHAHKRAQRHMEKLLLKDFWLQWNHGNGETRRRAELLEPE